MPNLIQNSCRKPEGRLAQNDVRSLTWPRNPRIYQAKNRGLIKGDQYYTDSERRTRIKLPVRATRVKGKERRREHDMKLPTISLLVLSLGISAFAQTDPVKINLGTADKFAVLAGAGISNDVARNSVES